MSGGNRDFKAVNIFTSDYEDHSFSSCPLIIQGRPWKFVCENRFPLFQVTENPLLVL